MVPRWPRPFQNSRYAALRARERARGFHVEVFSDVHAGGARVEVVHEIGDAAALAGAVPSFEQHHQADALDELINAFNEESGVLKSL